jgi:hypothetical protein
MPDESSPDNLPAFLWKHHQSVLLMVIAGCLVWTGTMMKDAARDARTIRETLVEARRQCPPISSSASGALTIKLDTVGDEVEVNHTFACGDWVSLKSGDADLEQWVHLPSRTRVTYRSGFKELLERLKEQLRK